MANRYDSADPYHAGSGRPGWRAGAATGADEVSAM
jgi:hypothetical protein